MAYSTDDFNRANGAPGSNWQQATGGSFLIVSNKLVRQPGGTPRIDWNHDLPSTDHYSEADVTGASVDLVAVLVRCSSDVSDTVGYIAFLDPGSSTAYIFRLSDFGNVAINPSFTHGDAHRLRLEAQGTTLRLYVDGSLVCSGTDSTFTTQVRVGLSHSETGESLDNFVTGDFNADLVVANGTHAHVADNVALDNVFTLVVADATHAHSAANVVLTLPGGAVFTDDFNRAGPGLSSDWAYDSALWQISGNKLQRTTSFGNEFAVFVAGDVGSPDMYVEADVYNTDTQFSVIHARTSETDRGVDAYEAYVTPGGDWGTIAKVVGGSFGVVETGTSGLVTPASSYHFRLEVEGSVQRFYVNGDLVATGDDTDITTGNFGGVNANSGGPYDSHDNFEVGALGAGPTPVDLTVNNAAHAHAAGNVDLVPNLVVANGAHAHSADNVVITTDTAAVATTSTEPGTSLATNNAIAAPTGVVTGNLLLAFCSHDNSATAITASTGWTSINQTVITSNVHRMAVFGRVADGGANDALSLSGTTSQDYCAAILRVVNHAVGSATVATDVKVAGTFSASSGAINPPNLAAGSTTTWLWIASGCIDATATGDTLTTQPSGYSVAVAGFKSASSTTSSAMAIAVKGANASSDDPGTFTNTSRPWIGITLAVPPLVPVTLTVANAAHAHTAANVVLVPDLVVDSATHAHVADNILFVPDLVVDLAVHAHVADNVVLVVDLLIDNGIHAHSADEVVLVVETVDLTVDSASHLHAADNVALVPDLLVDSGIHAHSAQEVVLVVDLTVDSAFHGHGATEIILGLPGELVVDGTFHGHTADNVELTQDHNLAVDGALHAHSAENVVLVVDLTVHDCAHVHTADNVVLVPTVDLVVDAAIHVHVSDNVDVTQQNNLVVDDAFHVHSVDNVTLGVGLVVADALHAHVAENLDLTVEFSLVVADSFHVHTAENVPLSTPDTLGVFDTTHAHSADNVDLTQDHLLAVDSALHGHTSDEVALVVDLVVDDAVHAHSATEPALTVDLVVAPALHGHTADEVTLNVGGIELLVADALHGHVAQAPVLVHTPMLVVDDCFHGHIATGALVFPPDSAPGEVDTFVLTDGVETTVMVDEVDMVVFVDAVDVTVIGGNQ